MDAGHTEKKPKTFLPEFPTDRFKKIYYPIRPLFTLAQGAILLSLGYLGILSMSLAVWLALLSIDDLSLVPFLRLSQSIDNLYHGRKKAKAIISIASILLGFVLGAALSLLVLNQIPAFTNVISTIINMMDCSFMLTAVGMIGGGLLARRFGHDPTIGMALGGLISWLPIHLPLFVESLFICTTASAFLFTIASKQALRLYYYLRYGDTNADGYEMNKSKKELDGINTLIAHNLTMHNPQGRPLSRHFAYSEDVAEMLAICREGVRGIKKRTHIGHEMTGSRLQLTNAFKDIFHTLKRSAHNSKDPSARDLLEISMQVAQQKTHQDTTGHSRKDTIPYLAPQYEEIAGKSRLDVTYNRHQHRLFHQQGLEGAFHKLGQKRDSYSKLHEKFIETGHQLLRNKSYR